MRPQYVLYKNRSWLYLYKWRHFFFYHLVTIGILGSTVEAQAQFKLVPKFVKKKTPLEQFLLRKVSFLCR